jgi:hypothetical protein
MAMFQWECTCPPRSVLVTVTLTDAAGNVRAVRETQFYVRPHHHHDRHGHHEH